jgi:hypothetical protein
MDWEWRVGPTRWGLINAGGRGTDDEGPAEVATTLLWAPAGKVGEVWYICAIDGSAWTITGGSSVAWPWVVWCLDFLRRRIKASRSKMTTEMLPKVAPRMVEFEEAVDGGFWAWGVGGIRSESYLRKYERKYGSRQRERRGTCQRHDVRIHKVVEQEQARNGLEEEGVFAIWKRFVGVSKNIIGVSWGHSIARDARVV